jgi:uncharacterized LabA/DUF88 family protein
MKVNIYIDGFNFYYGAVKGTPYKWLNLRALCELSLPRDDIQRIRYFTARVRSRPHDPTQHLRQQVYFNALQTLPNLTIHEGSFREREKRVFLPAAGRRKAQMALALVTEEKGSDVSLAAHLLMDGFKHDYEAAVIVSDDSDLIEPIRMVRLELGLRVGILNPQPARLDPRTSKPLRRYELEQAATSGFYRHIDNGLLPRCLFPDPVHAADGTLITKPRGW